jgi:hypothetical protein
MMNRRGLMLSLTTGLVALVLVVGSVIADELQGTITKVDADSKVLTVVPKDSEKEIKIKVTEKTEVSKKGGGFEKVDLEKLGKAVERAIDKGAKGIQVKITHQSGVASKIERTKKKASQ